MFTLQNDWQEMIADELMKPYFKELCTFLTQEYEEYVVYPEQGNVFRALDLTAYNDTKVVIVGQDPYHGAGQAHGLAFSVKSGVKIPPSLRNMYKELADDVGCDVPNEGNLEGWAKQGVLLLNTVLTVREGEAASHKGAGWERFTDAIIRALNDRNRSVIFVLWGKHAEGKQALITNDHHFIIKAPHPSPLSARRGFFGSKPYSKINQILLDLKQKPIKWDEFNR